MFLGLLLRQEAIHLNEGYVLPGLVLGLALQIPVLPPGGAKPVVQDFVDGVVSFMLIVLLLLYGSTISPNPF